MSESFSESYDILQFVLRFYVCLIVFNEIYKLQTS